MTANLQRIALLGSAAILLLLTSCLHDGVVSRVPLPGSDLTVVLSEDFKHLYSYQLFEHEIPVTDVRGLGPRYSDHCPPARVTSSAGVVSVDWGEGPYHHFVKVDVAHRKILGDTNQSGSPPEIRATQ